MIYDFLEAVRFLTILPVPKARTTDPDALARSMMFFPLVGALIGLITLLSYEVTSYFWPSRVASLSLIVVPIILTGGLHLDGFSDFCDGFFSGKERTGILAVMKDSRIGTWGACGVVLILLAKFELVQSTIQRAPMILLAFTASRWAQVMLAYFLRYAGTNPGLGSLVARKIGMGRLLVATACVLPFVLWLGVKGIIIFALLLPTLCLLGLYFKDKIGGMTGDLYGATSEITELFILMAVAWRL